MTQRRDEDVYMNIHTKAYKQTMSLSEEGICVRKGSRAVWAIPTNSHST